MRWGRGEVGREWPRGEEEEKLWLGWKINKYKNMFNDVNI